MIRQHEETSPLEELLYLKHDILHLASNGSLLEDYLKGPSRDVIRQMLILWPSEFQPSVRT